MKNYIYTFAFSVIFSTIVRADPYASRLRVRDIDNRPIRVQIDRGPIITDPRSAVIEYISPGQHQITVWIKGNYRNPHAYRLVHTGSIQIPAGSDVRAILGRNNRVRIHDIQPFVYPMAGTPFASTVYTYPVNGHCGTYGPTGMDEDRFRHVLAAMDHAGFESTRLQVARQAIQSSGIIRTAQIREILIRLDFESSRLNLARMAYPYAADQDNYYSLFDLFQFDSSIRELSHMMTGS
ncbi:MAG: DUF4476 domain-containing protein [Bacteroidota bacterium]|jgi:hypothetical protein